MGPLGQILQGLFGGLNDGILGAMQDLFQGHSNGPLGDLFSRRPTRGSREMKPSQGETGASAGARGSFPKTFGKAKCKT